MILRLFLRIKTLNVSILEDIISIKYYEILKGPAKLLKPNFIAFDLY
jgi:hypothetical protein